jgi:hypothetical protein
VFCINSLSSALGRVAGEGLGFKEVEGGVCAWVPYNPENKIVKQNTTPARTLNANEVFMREV